MIYNKPEMEVMKLEVGNIIITSFGDGGEGTPEGEVVIPPSQGDNWD